MEFPKYDRTIKRLCVLVFCLGVAVPLVQGLVRYRHLFGGTVEQFVSIQEADALVHINLAKRILGGYGFTNPPTIYNGRVVEDEPAFEKAPGYPYFLAAVFRAAGIGFAFFPIQCLFAGLMSVFLVLVSFEAFGSPAAALFAGLAAAVHPVLVNLASQLYNENLYFCMFFCFLWLYLRLYRSGSSALAFACGCLAGVTALFREMILSQFLLLAIWLVIATWRTDHATGLRSAFLMMLGLGAVILPWTIRNYAVSGEVVPVSVASIYLVGAGNNECVATGGWSTPYFGEDPCPPLDRRRAALLSELHQQENVLTQAKAQGTLGRRFILEHPGEYFKLCVRRAWTTFDPWHPRQHLRGFKRLTMLVYFLGVVAIGFLGTGWAIGNRPGFATRALILLLLVSYAPLVLVHVSHEHRLGIGIHVILACFAGIWLVHFEWVRQWIPRAWTGPAAHGEYSEA